MSNPYWPKTLIFIGAGSTAQLGSPATAKQGAMFRILGKDENGKSLSERVNEAFNSPQHNRAITDLLCCLGDKLTSNLYDFSEEEKEAANRLFPKLNEKERLDLVRQLREIYDWDALKKIIKIVPYMLKLIRDSRFIIMESTYPNMGAYFEAGYAEGLGKQVIVCCRKEEFDKQVNNTVPQKEKSIHFDIAQKQLLIWRDYEDLTKQLKEWIEALF